jgi:putative ABC transport system permease protein
MGATQPQLFALFAWEFLLLALGASLAGCALGFLVQELVAWSLAALIPGTLPAPGPVPLVQGGATGLVLLLGFALPPLLQLKEVPALRVIRRDVGPPRQGALAVYILGFASVFALLLWQAGELKLAAYVLGGFAAAFAIFAALGYGALKAIGRYGRTGGISWRYGLANLLRRPRANTVQIVAIAVGLTAILLLTVIRADLIDVWRGRLPADAPDRFLVNIQPEQRRPLAEFFEKNGGKPPQAFPMVRARLVAVNGKPVGAGTSRTARQAPDRARVQRDVHDDTPDNKVSTSAWFSGPSPAGNFMMLGLNLASASAIRSIPRRRRLWAWRHTQAQ